MTDLEQLRLTIGDTGVNGEENRELHTGRAIMLPHNNVSEVHVFKEGQEVEHSFISGSTIMVDGAEVGDTVNVVYKYYTFSDSELTDILSDNAGKISAAGAQCVSYIMADAARMFDYKSGQSEMKMSQVFDNLNTLYAVLKARAQNEDPTTGGEGMAFIVGRVSC